MARPRKEQNAVETRVRILEAALQEFGRVGVSEARLEDIAQAADIRRASLLHHYASKDRLYQKTLEHVFNELGAQLAHSMTQKSAEPGIEALTRSFQKFVVTRPAIARVLLREMIRPDGEGFPKIMDEVNPILDGVVEFLKTSAGKKIRNPKAVRQGVLQTVFAVLIRAAMAEKSETLWGKGDYTFELSRAMLLKH